MFYPALHSFLSFLKKKKKFTTFSSFWLRAGRIGKRRHVLATSPFFSLFFSLPVVGRYFLVKPNRKTLDIKSIKNVLTFNNILLVFLCMSVCMYVCIHYIHKYISTYITFLIISTQRHSSDISNL